jgi:hypothetical protein
MGTQGDAASPPAIRGGQDCPPRESRGGQSCPPRIGSKALPDQTTVRLSGVAPTETIVTQALAALELSPAFDRVVLVESKPEAQPYGRAFVLEIVAAVAKATRE